jgi:hypothetical protein
VEGALLKLASSVDLGERVVVKHGVSVLSHSQPVASPDAERRDSTERHPRYN